LRATSLPHNAQSAHEKETRCTPGGAAWIWNCVQVFGSLHKRKVDDSAAPMEPPRQRTIVACTNCWKPPAPGDKLKYCGRCETESYCSPHCAKEGWAEHKLVCEGMRKARKSGLAQFEAQGGRKQDFNQRTRDITTRFDKLPGFTNEIMLLAWTHRGDSPFIHAFVTNQGDDWHGTTTECLLSKRTWQTSLDGSGVRVEMMPGSFWDEDPRFPNIYSENLRGQLRERYGRSTFCPNKQYVRMVSMQDSEGRPARVTTTNYFDDKVVRGAEIVEALTTATKAEDLVDAFAWFETVYSSSDAHDMLQDIRHRAKLLSGCTAQQGSVPVPSRALNNEVACRIFDALDLAFDVCLIGLRGAGHLNGRQGVIHGLDHKNYERWKAQLDDGTYVSVKAINFERIRLGDYKRIFKP